MIARHRPVVERTRAYLLAQASWVRPSAPTQPGPQDIEQLQLEHDRSLQAEVK